MIFLKRDLHSQNIHGPRKLPYFLQTFSALQKIFQSSVRWSFHHGLPRFSFLFEDPICTFLCGIWVSISSLTILTKSLYITSSFSGSFSTLDPRWSSFCFVTVHIFTRYGVEIKFCKRCFSFICFFL